MRRGICQRLNRVVIVAVVATMSVALVSGFGSRLPMAPARAVSYDVVETAAIEESPTTIGVAEGADLYFASQADVDRTLDALQSLGVQNVRIAIFWAGVEGTEGEYDWTSVDRMVDAAEARGMGILGTINHTPSWAGTPELTGHPDPAKFGEFVGAVAERYKGRVSTYEIWNEPTTTIFWDPNDPVAYTELLKAGYTAIKAVDESAIVVAGSVVAGPDRADGLAMSPVSFVEAMYDAGAQGYFDALSYHPYLFNTPFSEGQDKPYFDYPIEQLHAIRELMAQHGDGDLKVWITEYGQPTTTLADGTVITEEQQAAFIADLIRTWQDIDGAGPVFIYNARDTETGSSNPDFNLGLYYSDWTPKASAGVLADLIAELTAQQPEPVNPLAAFIQQIVRVIGQALNVIPAFINAVVRTITNWVGAIVGVNKAVVGAPPPEVAPVGSRGAVSTATATDDVIPDTLARRSSVKTDDEPPAVAGGSATAPAVEMVDDRAVVEAVEDVAGEPAVADVALVDVAEESRSDNAEVQAEAEVTEDSAGEIENPDQTTVDTAPDLSELAGDTGGTDTPAAPDVDNEPAATTSTAGTHGGPADTGTKDKDAGSDSDGGES